MKTQKGEVPKNKLRQKLQKLFKTGKINYDDRPNGAARKVAAKTKSLQQDSANVKKYDKVPDEGIPNSRKRRLAKNKLKTKAEASPESKKAKRKTKTASFLESDCLKVNTHHGIDNTSKPAKSKTKKKTTPLQNEGKDHLLRVHRNGRESPSDNGNVLVAYEEDYCFDDDYDDFNDSNSDDFSPDSDIFFEETDSSNYEGSEYSDSGSEFLYGSGSDPDYELPLNIPEDLVIRKGRAHTRDLSKDENVNFDSGSDNPQIFELSPDSTTKVIKQPEKYAKNELHKLNKISVCMKNVDIKTGLRKLNESDRECPALVPIYDKYRFQQYNVGSEYSSYEELSSDSTIDEIDINQKYVHHGIDGDGDGNERIKSRNPVLSVGIINVKNCIPVQAYKNGDMKVVENSNRTEIDEPISECLATKNLALDIDENIIITASIFEAPTFTEMPEEFVKNINAISASHLILEGEVQNGNVIQATHTKMIIDEDVSILPESQGQIKNTNRIGYSDTESLSNVTQLQQKIDIDQEHLIFRTLCFNAVNSNLVLVLAKDPFYLYGTVCMTILAGKVEIYGYSPRLKEEFEIFSTRGCSSVKVTTVSSVPNSEDEEICVTLKPLLSSFSSSDLEHIERDFESGRDAILLLKRNTRRKKLKNIFKKYMNENVFPNMNSIQTDRPLYASEYLLDCVINTESERALRVPQEWRDLNFSPKSKILIAGGKSVGKSTLLRYLLNCQLEHCKSVLVIDLDIGQAELFIPQTVSCTAVSRPLLGPGFFLNHQPTRAYVVGHSNIVLCAQTYVRAVKELIHFCYSEEEFAEIPWLINTMGYNKGFGMELMSIISQLIKPTDIVQLQSNRDINNFDELLYPHVLARTPRTIYEFFEKMDKSPLEYKLHVLCSAIVQESRYQRDWEMSAKDLRYATFLSRLSEVLQDNADWLTDCVPLSALIEKLHLVNLVCNEHTREELVQAFEANVVYLCRKEDNNGPIECFGIGIVRAIDLKKLYLLPAMAYDYLREVNCLVLGEMPLPSSLFTNQGPKVRKMAAFLYDTVDGRTSKSIKQMYHRPSQFLTGKHKKVLDD